MAFHKIIGLIQYSIRCLLIFSVFQKIIRVMPSIIKRFLDPGRFDGFDFLPVVMVRAVHTLSRRVFYVSLHDHIGYRLLVDGKYDDELYYVSEHLGLSENDIYVDIGSNIGTTVIPISEDFKVEAYAFEIENQTASLLLKNCAGLKNPPVCIAVGCGDLPNEKVEIYAKKRNRGATSIYQDWYGGTPIGVGSLRPLDQFEKLIDWNRVKLVKLDVEGAELKVLRGGRNLISSKAVIYVEVKKRLDGEFNQSREAVLSLLQSRGALAEFDSRKQEFKVLQKDEVKNAVYSLPRGFRC